MMKRTNSMDNKWHPIEEYPKYEVNVLGQIRNKTSKKILKYRVRPNDGMLSVTIIDKDGKTRVPHIDMLVAKTFLHNPDPEKYDVLKHKDGNPGNCAADNLVWTEDDTAKKLSIAQIGKEYPDDYYTFYPLVEFPDSLYEINKMGQVRNKTNHKLLKGGHRDGYVTYTLYIDSKIVFRTAHALVARQFIPNPDNKKIVNHIDEDRSNPCVDNLEWVSQSENSKHGTAQERSNRGRNKPVNEYSLQGKYIRTWKSLRLISNYFNILFPETNNRSNLQRVISNNSNEEFEKLAIADRIFMYYKGSFKDENFIIKKSKLKTYKNHSLEGVVVPNEYFISKQELRLSYVEILKGIRDQFRLTQPQKESLEYALDCIKDLEKYKKQEEGS